MLLADIRGIFDELGTDRIKSEVLAQTLAEMEGRPWAEWGKNKKPLTKNQLAAQLKPFSIFPEKIRFEKSLQGYERHQFSEAWERYLTPYRLEQRNNADEIRTSEPFQGGTENEMFRSENAKKPNNDGVCSDVPVQNPPEALPRAHSPRDDLLGVPDFLNRLPENSNFSPRTLMTEDDERFAAGGGFK